MYHIQYVWLGNRSGGCVALILKVCLVLSCLVCVCICWCGVKFVCMCVAFVRNNVCMIKLSGRRPHVVVSSANCLHLHVFTPDLSDSVPSTLHLISSKMVRDAMNAFAKFYFTDVKLCRKQHVFFGSRGDLSGLRVRIRSELSWHILNENLACRFKGYKAGMV